MSKNSEPLRVFVAMPGSDMGASARWKEPEQIKKYFFQRISERLQKALRRPVKLVIEKDKVLGGSIHASMFKEAWEADVYIADLTGNNPNVYLELGVRWALKDNITVVVSQDVGSIKFNAAASRGIPYKDDPEALSKAIEDVVKAITEGLVEQHYLEDTEAWNNLGGVLRKLGMKNSPNDCNWEVLLEARNSYNQAATLDEHNAYALGNVARLDLILSQIEPDRKNAAMDEFETLRLLCSIKRKKAPNDYWLIFDLADTYLFVDDVNKGHKLYSEAVQLVPTDYRESILSSVTSLLKEILSLGAIEEQIKAVVQEIIEEPNQAHRQSSGSSSRT
jgi:tetratricopeptide (TPR) repeat protein